MSGSQKKFSIKQEQSLHLTAALHVWSVESPCCKNWKMALEKEGFSILLHDLHTHLEEDYTKAFDQEKNVQPSIHFYEFSHDVSYVHYLQSFLPMLQEKGIFTVLLTPASYVPELGESLDVIANWVLPCEAQPTVIQSNLQIMLQLIRIQNFFARD